MTAIPNGVALPSRYLSFMTDAELGAEVAAMAAPRWLARPVIPADAYWILAAEDKAGKSWGLADLAVSVAYGGQWLDAFPCDTTGPVVMFFGEGGHRKLDRRLAAVKEHKGVTGSGQIHISFRVPHLSVQAHLDEVRSQVGEVGPALVMIDPLYLAARGANGADLYAMGEALEGIQHIVQDADASLAISTHYRKGEADSSFQRITGVGPGAWGRVLVTGDVKQRQTDPTTKATNVTLDVRFRGDEIPDTTIRIRRHVVADNPDDLRSPLRYRCEVVAVDADEAADSTLTPSVARVLAALSADEPRSIAAIGDLIANDGHGHPLKARTIQKAIATLAEHDRADSHTDPADPRGRRMLAWAT